VTEIRSQKADLHLHTTASDGARSPEDVLQMVYDRGLRCMAITDHDTIDGYIQIADKARELGVTVVPGVEITTNYIGRECHILAYAFDVSDSPLLALLRSQRSVRLNRAGQIIQKLNTLGFDLDLDDVRAESGKATISRNHIASVLQQKNYVATKQEAFNRFLGGGGPAYVQNGYPEASDVITLIKASGGVSILAHPGPYYIYEDLRYFLQAGIDGLEYIHPSHNWNVQKKLMDYAENYGLLLTGGSDFHGFRQYEEQNVGVVSVDLSRVDALLSRSKISMEV